jgi:FKBP-type peptidyl-prolyl cis-trans isomerase 2
LKKGDIVHIDYEAWLIENDELFDTTKEELAKEKEIYNEKVTYKPIPIIVGAGNVVKGLDENLLKAKVKKDYTIELEPKDGFGERDPKLIETHHIREIMRLPEFKKGDKEPYVGMQITINNKMGWISRITAGRVRVDFNNRYAGHRLKYSYKVTNHADSQEKKIQAILEMHYGKIEGFEIKAAKNNVNIKLPDTCKYDLGWFQAKYRVVTDLREYANVNNVQFIEEYLKKVEEKGKSKGKGKEKEIETGKEKGKDKKVEKGEKGDKDTKASKDTEDKEGKDKKDEKDTKDVKVEEKAKE